MKFGPNCNFRAKKLHVEDFHRDLEKKLDVFPNFQQKKQQMLKMLPKSGFWSNFEIFRFLVKFGVQALTAREKRLYQKIL